MMQKFRDSLLVTLILVLFISLSSFYLGQTTKVVFVNASAKDISVNEALQIIDAGRISHQYFIDHPSAIKFPNGDVAYQKRWVNNYNALEGLILQQQKIINEFKKK